MMRSTSILHLALLLCGFQATEFSCAVRHAAGQAPREVRLDFDDADIRAVISALAELTGANVTYGPLPSRNITLRTHRPVPTDSLWAIFMSLLKANGLSVQEQGGILHIGQAEERAARPDTLAVPPGQMRLFVMRLKHAHATEVAATVNALFGRAAVGVAGRPSLSAVGLSAGLRESLVPPGLPQTPVQPVPQAEIEAAPTGAVQGEAAELEAEVTIVPDIATNSLLVRATVEDFEVIRSAVDKLDVRPQQVMIEVVIAEARRDALTQIGLDVLLSNEPAASDVQVESRLSERILGNLVARIMYLDDIKVDALFEALSVSSDVKILSRPVLVTANNQEAHILVGSERPFIQVSRALPTDAAVRDQIVQFRDVGTKLSIIPTINYDGCVALTLHQEVSAATAETQFGAPVISTREAATRLLVRDGQTVVIGGLIDRQQERTRSGVPLLKDIPVLGALFGSSSWRTVETELFLFLTPHVLATDVDADRARESIKEAAPRIREHLPGPLLPPDTTQADTLRPGGSDRL